MTSIIVWFRDDLRVTDNPTLADAIEGSDEVIPVYIFDPRDHGETRYKTDKCGPHRTQFRRESVHDLRASLEDRGGSLFVRQGRSEVVLSELTNRTDAEAVYAQTKPAVEELQREQAVRDALPEGVSLDCQWTHTLYHIRDLPTAYDRIEDTYTPWRKEVEAHGTVRDLVAAPEEIQTPDLKAGTVPTQSELGIAKPPMDNRAVLPIEGGESTGKRRLQKYIWAGDHLREYKATRNQLLGANYSSKFSAWLAAGCLSPRWIHSEIQRYENERVENEDTYWLVFELLWRDFLQFQFEKHGADFFTPTGIQDVDNRWDHDRDAFRKWADGSTGVPFVDANMRELNRTGYMSNRGRQNVASFLADTLGIDWRWGAAYFESHLIDYDVASNWGNWAYQAGVGNDSRDNYFNVLSQAERYDSEAEYVSTWLPELAGLSPTFAHRPWRMNGQEQNEYGVELGMDYPRPMLDIEARYSELRNAS